MARRPSSVCPSVNFCANRFFSQTNGRIATKLAHDGLRVSVHPGCAQGQGQGQRSRDTRAFLDSWNELYSVIDGLVSLLQPGDLFLCLLSMLVFQLRLKRSQAV